LLSPAATAEIVIRAIVVDAAINPVGHTGLSVSSTPPLSPVSRQWTHTCRAEIDTSPVATMSHTQSIVANAVTTNDPSRVDFVETATHLTIVLTRSAVSSSTPPLLDEKFYRESDF
jgi:hypothetical protein